MTVCVAALANDSKAIVLIADKALTYGDNFSRPAMQGESGGIEKMLPIGQSGWNALLAGNSTVVEDVVRLAEDKIVADPSIGQSYALMMDCVKMAYQDVREQAVIDQILQPNLLTKETYIARSNTLLPLQDSYFLSLAQTVTQFNAGGSVLVCGFDVQEDGRIFSVEDPGVVSSHEVAGFHAIGVGTETAIASLLWRAAEPEDTLDVALYQAHEAKVRSEQIQGVGGICDIWIMLPGATHRVPEEIHALLVDVFLSANQMPFRAKEDLSRRTPFPRNWESRLKEYVDGIMGGQPGTN